MGIVTLVSRFKRNAYSPIEVILSGNVRLVRGLLSNTPFSMEVIPLGMVTSDNWFPINAYSPIVLTLSGIVTLVSRLPENALLPMEVTLFGISRLVS